MTTPTGPAVVVNINYGSDPNVVALLEQLGVDVASISQQLTEHKAAVTDFIADVTAKLDQLAAAQGEFTPEAQAQFDEIKGALAAADSQIGDADGSDTPVEPVEPPVEPAPGEPTA